MYPDIIDACAGDDYRLLITFADGQRREVDISTMVPFEGVFAPLQDRGYFASVTVNSELGTVVWPNGADLCPDVLRTSGRLIETPASVP